MYDLHNAYNYENIVFIYYVQFSIRVSFACEFKSSDLIVLKDILYINENPSKRIDKSSNVKHTNLLWRCQLVNHGNPLRNTLADIFRFWYNPARLAFHAFICSKQ
jgi:hypothetical protein